MMRWKALFALASLLLLPGCGKELLAGGFTGRVDAVATDSQHPQQQTGSERPAGTLLASEAAALPQGTIDLQAAVSLIREDGVEVQLTPGSVSARLRLAAGDSVVLGGADVGVARYVSVRIAFSQVEANVTSGLTIIGGVQLLGIISVALGTQPLLIEAPVELRVQEGGSHQVVMNLNSSVWLAAAGLDRRVSAAVFRDAIRVAAR